MAHYHSLSLSVSHTHALSLSLTHTLSLFLSHTRSLYHPHIHTHTRTAHRALLSLLPHFISLHAPAIFLNADVVCRSTLFPTVVCRPFEIVASASPCLSLLRYVLYCLSQFDSTLSQGAQQIEQPLSLPLKRQRQQEGRQEGQGGKESQWEQSRGRGREEERFQRRCR